MGHGGLRPRGSSLPDGSWGVYYTARTRDAAIAQTAHHVGRFYRASGEPALEVSMRVLVAGVAATLHDIRGADRRYRAVHDPADHGASQRLARTLRARRSNGIVYDCVRRPGDACVAAFRPRVIRPLPVEDGFLLYHWNGDRIDRFFEHASESWMDAPGPVP